MAQEVALVVLLRIGDQERHRLAGGIQFGFGDAVFVAHDTVRRAAVAV